MTNKIKQILIKDMKNAAVPQLISMWKQGELSLREQGILLEVLAKIGNKDAFPIFFGLLEDDRFREQTITAMENMESYALPELIKALADPIKREGAAQALSKMPEAAMGPLREILKNSQESVAIRSQIPLIIVNMHRDKQAVSIFDDILENSQNANIYLPVWKAMGKVRKPVPRVVKIIDKLKRIDPGAREILLEKKNRKEAVSELSRYWKKYITAKNPKANQVSMLEGIINEITQKDEGAKRIWINRLLSYFRGHKKLRMEMANRLGNINWNNVRPSIKKNTASTLKRYLNDKNPQLKSKVTGILNVIDSEKKWH